eukprot:TRINITY_DN9485_c0_g2_i3.p1 TRINITY_DN9485_c0_g2~~TRINITY_DN9485_c0_g2_i3.p1  ORF type:complete len:1075 (-),score=280.91 TRINITY_DN9485_c0_g2_i3:39-3263(-)
MERSFRSVSLLILLAVGSSLGFTCSETGLNAAFAAGGEQTLECNGPSVVTISGTKNLGAELVLNGAGVLTIRGNGVQLISAGFNLILKNMRLEQILISNGANLYLQNTTLQTISTNVSIVDNRGFLYLDNSMIFNSASTGGLVNNKGFFYCTSSTITSYPTISPGWGIEHIVGSFMKITFCTITGFDVALMARGVVDMTASVVVGKFNSTTATYSGDFNVLSAPNPGFTFLHNQYNVNPALLFGNFYDTIGFLTAPCSPAINVVGEVIEPPLSDQNGDLRSRNGAPDAGAVESNLRPCLSLVGDTSVGENGVALSVGLQLSGPSVPPVEIYYSVTDGTAKNGTDYRLNAANGTFTFEFPVRSDQLIVPIIDNQLYDLNRSFFIRWNASSAVQFNQSGVVEYTIVNNDPIPSVSFSSAVYNVNESDGGIMIRLQLSNPSSYGIEVSVSVVVGSVSPAEISTNATVLRIRANTTYVDFWVSILDDHLYEGDEDFQIQISGAPVNATLGSVTTCSVIIHDYADIPRVFFDEDSYVFGEGDSTRLLVVRLSSPSQLPVSVDFSLNFLGSGTSVVYPQLLFATTPSPLQFDPQVTEVIVEFSMVDDAVRENDERYTLTLSNPTGAALGNISAANVLLIDNDVPGASFTHSGFLVVETVGTFAVDVTLNITALDPVTVNISVVSLGAVENEDFYVMTSLPLVFLPGQMQLLVEIYVVEDEIREKYESFSLVISAVDNGAVGQDPVFNVGIDDVNDDPLVTFDRSYGALEVDALESDGFVDFYLSLNIPTAFDAVLNVSIARSAAIEGEFFRVETTSVDFSNYLTLYRLRVYINDNNIFQGMKYLNLTLSSASYLTLGQDLFASIRIIDDDLVPSITLSLASNAAPGSYVCVDVLLSNPTEREVAAIIAINGSAIEGKDYTITDRLITFAPLQTRQSFYVTTLHKNAQEGRGLIVLKLKFGQVDFADASKSLRSEVQIIFVDVSVGKLTRRGVIAIGVCAGIVALSIALISFLVVRKKRGREAIDFSEELRLQNQMEMKSSQCPNCKTFVHSAAHTSRITCRCGTSFCISCGSEWPCAKHT